VKLHHVDDGPRDAPALVLVGSLGSTLAMWEPQLTLAGAGPVAEPDRGNEVDPVHERPAVLPQHDDHFPAGPGDLRGPSPAGQADRGAGVVRPDDGRVDVGEPVDLGRAEESDVDPARLEPVVEDLRHADHGVGGLGQHPVADGQRERGRLGADRAGLVDQREAGSVGRAGQVRRLAGEADADEAGHAVAQGPGCGDGHHLVGGVTGGPARAGASGGRGGGHGAIPATALGA